MTRIIRAELIRLLRRRTIVVAAAGAALLAVISTFTLFSNARPSGGASLRSGVAIAALTGHGGGTRAFAVGASFIGFLVFVTFIALIATEFSGGTFRAVVLREPRRLRVLVGKLAGALVVAALAIAFSEVCTFVLSLLIAPTKDISTTAWFSLAGLGAGLHDYATVFAGVAGWAIFGATLGVVFRSAPLALGVGFAWAGPFEHIVVDSWTAGRHYFPGLVLESLIRGGTIDLGLGRTLVTATLYAGIAAITTLVLVSRRDVTA